MSAVFIWRFPGVDLGSWTLVVKTVMAVADGITRRLSVIYGRLSPSLPSPRLTPLGVESCSADIVSLLLPGGRGPVLLSAAVTQGVLLPAIHGSCCGVPGG